MSEEARRYGPHFVGPFARTIDLGERKNPSSVSDFRTTLVEPLSDARTMLADFFSILLADERANSLAPMLVRHGAPRRPFPNRYGCEQEEEENRDGRIDQPFTDSVRPSRQWLRGNTHRISVHGFISSLIRLSSDLCKWFYLLVSACERSET